MRRKTTGTGRMRYLKDTPRRFKNGFREGPQRPPSLSAPFPARAAVKVCLHVLGAAAAAPQSMLILAQRHGLQLMMFHRLVLWALRRC